jgi:hypothetical protein
MITPLPDKLKWMKFGIGLGFRHYLDIGLEKIAVVDTDTRYKIHC